MLPQLADYDERMERPCSACRQQQAEPGEWLCQDCYAEEMALRPITPDTQLQTMRRANSVGMRGDAAADCGTMGMPEVRGHERDDSED